MKGRDGKTTCFSVQECVLKLEKDISHLALGKAEYVTKMQPAIHVRVREGDKVFVLAVMQ